ncbi:MAG: hypothetical protein J0L92_35755, partial [Deltaproteobacteria bacterium]|nr:hypothetical protein [Deltaproteobacteria bacterium]
WAMLARGVLELSQADAAARGIVEGGWRTAPMGVLCRSLAGDAASREAARTSSTLREGAALLHGSRRHGLQTLACAGLAGDQALESEARAQVSTDTQRRAFELSVALAPWSRYAELRDLLP